MKRIVFLLSLGLLALLTACRGQGSADIPAGLPTEDSAPSVETETEIPESGGTSMLKIEIGDAVLTARLGDTAAAEALKEKLEEGSVTVSVSNYGGWEKVGDLPWSLPASDEPTQAAPGDIMLYRGRSIVLFYGNNSWDYTRLGTVVHTDADALARILEGNDSKLTLSLITE